MSPLFSSPGDPCDGADRTLGWRHETQILMSALQPAFLGVLDKLGLQFLCSIMRTLVYVVSGGPSNADMG